MSNSPVERSIDGRTAGQSRAENGTRRSLSAIVLTVVVISAVLAAGIGFSAGAAGNTGGITNTIVVDDDPSAGEYNSIDAAIANASGGDTITVRSGTYKEQVTVDRSVTIVADDNATLVGNDTLNVGVTVTADNVTVRGLAVRNYAKWGVTVVGDGVRLRRLHVAENEGGVKFADTTDSTLRTATVTGYDRYQASGIYAVNARNVTIRNASLSSDTHIVSDDLTFDNVTNGAIVETNVTQNPIHAVVLRNGTTDVTVADNYLRNSKRDALFINHSSGNVVDGNVIVGTGESGTYYDEDGIHVQASSNTTITNNRIRGSTGAGIAISDPNQLANNTLVENGGAGVSVTGLDDAVLSNVTARNNGHGIRVAHAENLTVTNANLTGNHHGVTLMNTTDSTVLNTLTRDHNTGYYFENTSGTLLADSRGLDGKQNNLQTPPGRGVQLVSTNGTELRNVTLVENGNIGVLATGTEDVVVADSRLVDNQYYGLRIRNGATNTTIANTTVRDHQDVGVEVTSGAVTLRDNQIVDNYDYGVEVTSGVAPSSVTVVDNVIHGSDGYAGLRNRNGSATLDATHNWWGDASGPGGSHGGVGDEVIGNVTMDPFYVDRSRTTLSTEASPAELAGVTLPNFSDTYGGKVRPYEHTRVINASRATYDGADYYVALHERTANGSLSPAIGNSTRLSPGVHDAVPIHVNVTASTGDDVDALTDSGTYVAVVHRAGTDGMGAPLAPNGDPVTDDGYVGLRPIPNITFTNQTTVGGTQTVHIESLNRTGGSRFDVHIYEELTPNDDTRNLSEPLDSVVWYDNENPKTDVEMKVAGWSEEVTENTTYVVRLSKAWKSEPLDTPVPHAASARLTVLPYQDDIVVDTDPGQGDTSSISGALANASTNATIDVREGVYREQLTIEKDVTIRATNATLNGTTIEPSSGPSTAITLDSKASATIDGLDITGYDRAVDAGGSNANWTVTNAAITDTDGTAIDAYHSNRNWRINNVLIRNATGVAINATDSSGDWRVRNVRIEDVGNATRTVHEDPPTSGDWQVSNARIEDVGNVTRTAHEEDSPILTRPGRGIDARRTGGDWTIRSTTILNTTIAVRASGTGEMRVAESRLETATGINATVGSWAADEAGGGSTSKSAVPVNATHNWWGDTSGPSGNITSPAGVVADGGGSTVVGAVTFAPFYADQARQTLALGGSAADFSNDGNASTATAPVDVVNDGSPVDEVSVRVTADVAGSVDVTVTDSASVPGNVTALPRVNQTLSVVDVTVPTSVRDTAGRVTMRVDRNNLHGTPSTLHLVHYDAATGGWEMLSTTVVATTDQSVTVAAETDGFSPFAVVTIPSRSTDGSDSDDSEPTSGGGAVRDVSEPSGAGENASEPSFTVRFANPVSNLTAGERVGITARVTNEGDDATVFDAVWYVDDRQVSRTSRTVGANATRTFVLNHTFDEAGTYALSLSKHANSTVTVREHAPNATGTTTGPSTADGGTEPPADDETRQRSDSPEPTTSSGAGFGVALSVVALVLVALLARRSE